MRRLAFAASTMLLAVGAWMIGNVKVAVADDRNNDKNMALVDECDPADPGWTPTGGCALKPGQGDVSFAEFGALVRSPNSLSTVGHPAWRIEPSYVSSHGGDRTVQVTNHGGRLHTFTEVQDFGGGRVPGLNVGLIEAQGCINAGTTTDVAPGARMDVTLSPGLHKFQCCIHPWMRAAVRIQ
jgi:hypothetical protein